MRNFASGKDGKGAAKILKILGIWCRGTKWCILHLQLE